jgi:hypothetical protein
VPCGGRYVCNNHLHDTLADDHSVLKL